MFSDHELSLSLLKWGLTMQPVAVSPCSTGERALRVGIAWEYDTFCWDFSASGSCGRGLSLWWSATTSSWTVMIEFIDIKIVIAQPGARALPAQLGPLL